MSVSKHAKLKLPHTSGSMCKRQLSFHKHNCWRGEWTKVKSFDFTRQVLKVEWLQPYRAAPTILPHFIRDWPKPRGTSSLWKPGLHATEHHGKEDFWNCKENRRNWSIRCRCKCLEGCGPCLTHGFINDCISSCSTPPLFLLPRLECWWEWGLTRTMGKCLKIAQVNDCSAELHQRFLVTLLNPLTMGTNLYPLGPFSGALCQLSGSEALSSGHCYGCSLLNSQLSPPPSQCSRQASLLSLTRYKLSDRKCVVNLGPYVAFQLVNDCNSH